RPGDVVGDGGGTDATFGADHGDDAADRFRLGCREQVADRAHDVDRGDRRDDVVADATANQLAVQGNVVDAADYDHAGTGIADGGELIEPGQDVAADVGLEHDHVRRRRSVIGLDGGGHAAHLDLQMCLAEPAVLTG